MADLKYAASSIDDRLTKSQSYLVGSSSGTVIDTTETNITSLIELESDTYYTINGFMLAEFEGADATINVSSSGISEDQISIVSSNGNAGSFSIASDFTIPSVASTGGLFESFIFSGGLLTTTSPSLRLSYDPSFNSSNQLTISMFWLEFSKAFETHQI